MKFDWIQNIKVGDVLQSGSGRLRIVRSVHHYPGFPHSRCCVTFAINRCSWTHRPYTVLTDYDLRERNFSSTGVNVKLKSKFDRDLAQEWKRRGPPLISCCEVVGLP